MRAFDKEPLSCPGNSDNFFFLIGYKTPYGVVSHLI